MSGVDSHQNTAAIRLHSVWLPFSAARFAAIGRSSPAVSTYFSAVASGRQQQDITLFAMTSHSLISIKPPKTNSIKSCMPCREKGYCAMRKRFVFKRTLAALLCAAVVLSLGNSSGEIAEDQDAARPTLADLMALTQLRHYKLWYSERLENWKLADYELSQLVATVDRIKKLYPETHFIAQANLIQEKTDPALKELSAAIQGKNNKRFEVAFNQITDACNQCHRAAGVDFILVRVPWKSPYNNQMFTPNPDSRNRP